MFDRRFLRYFIVGAISAILDIVSVGLLISTNMHYGLAVTLGFIAGLIANYLLHVAYTFQARLHIVSQAIRYGVVVALNYLLTMAIVWCGHDVLGASVLAAKLASLPCIALTGFLLSKYWVFQQICRD